MTIHVKYTPPHFDVGFAFNAGTRDNAVKDLFDQDQIRVGNCNMSQIHGHTFAGSSMLASTEHRARSIAI